METGKAKVFQMNLDDLSPSERLSGIRERIQAALKKSPHGPRSVTIVGACKAQSLIKIRSFAEMGVMDMGQNYAQELLTKAPMCMDLNVRWHFIGNLQSNKVKQILPYVSSIQTVDSVELAKRISRVAEQTSSIQKPIPIMIQTNFGHERQKSGLPPQVVESLFAEFMKVDGVELVGLMTIPPVHKDAEKMRPYFKDLKSLFEKLKPLHRHPERFTELSMGMSNDFEVAVEEGATCVRIGTSLFGPRPA